MQPSGQELMPLARTTSLAASNLLIPAIWHTACHTPRPHHSSRNCRPLQFGSENRCHGFGTEALVSKGGGAQKSSSSSIAPEASTSYRTNASWHSCSCSGASFIWRIQGKVQVPALSVTLGSNPSCTAASPGRPHANPTPRKHPRTPCRTAAYRDPRTHPAIPRGVKHSESRLDREVEREGCLGGFFLLARHPGK